MIDRYVVDFDESFVGAMVRAVEPKMQPSDKNNPRSEQVQARDKDGVARWTVILSMETKSFGDKSKYDDIPVTITEPAKPSLVPGTYVTVERLEMGVMVQQRGGLSFFYSARSIRPLQSTPSMQQPPRTVPVQPQQTVRPASQ